MAFNPADYGATPATATSGFNPAQFGATAVPAPAVPSGFAAKPDSFLSMATAKASPPTSAFSSSGLSQLPGQLGGLVTGAIGSLGNSHLGTEIGNSVSGLAGAIKSGSMTPINQANVENHADFNANPLGVPGDVASDVATPVSLALGAGEGESAAARIGNAALKYGTVGAAAGAGSAASNGSNPIIGAAEGGALGAFGGAAAQGVGEAGPAIADSFNALTQKQTPLQQTIDAVDPNLTPGKTAKAYQSVVTGNRTVTPSSIFQEQSLSPDQKTVNLGTRLQDLGLGRNPVQNLNTLGTALDNTETQLQAALKANPDIPANKPTLIAKLDDLKTQIPEEYKGIKESNTTFNAVLNYAKNKVAAAADDIGGLRSARTAFDNQAKSDFPSAFKNGTIDVGTPAGRAIALARDTIAEHTYNIAPNGSELQSLIGREADIFRATEAIAPKAAKGEGANTIQQIIKAHPTLAKIAGYGLTAFGGGEVAKHLGL